MKSGRISYINPLCGIWDGRLTPWQGNLVGGKTFGPISCLLSNYHYDNSKIHICGRGTFGKRTERSVDALVYRFVEQAAARGL
jgi:hypothetical protein